MEYRQPKYYPSTAYPWLWFRNNVLSKNETLNASSVVTTLKQQRHRLLPKRYRKATEWKKLRNHIQCYCDALLSDSIAVKQTDLMGFGIIAKRDLKKGWTSLAFGSQHQVKAKQRAALERKYRETSFSRVDHTASQGRPTKRRKSSRNRPRHTQVFYMAGLASLINSSCHHLNARLKPQDDGNINLELTSSVSCGDEILIDYDVSYWDDVKRLGIICLCSGCADERLRGSATRE